MKIKHALLTAAITLPLITSTAWAAGSGQQKQSGAQMGQQQGQQQSQPGQAARFDQLDANGDGYLTEDELNIHGSTAAGQSGAETSMKSRKMMQHRDQNQDGLISREEFQGDKNKEVGE